MTKDSMGNEMPPEMAGSDIGPHGFPPEAWVFTPTTDIKVKELAEVLAIFKMGMPPDFFENEVPDHLKKHFTWKAFD
jgi:hypothetical protein